MAELTTLEDALAEAMGRARAARQATARVGRGVAEGDIAAILLAMRGESAEISRRAEAIVAGRDGRKTAIRERARAASRAAREMTAGLVGEDGDAVRGVEALAVAQAAELGNLEVLGGLALAAGDAQVGGLVEWALPLRRRHVAELRDAGLVLAAQADPAATAPAPS